MSAYGTYTFACTCVYIVKSIDVCVYKLQMYVLCVCKLYLCMHLVYGKATFMCVGVYRILEFGVYNL